MKVSSISNESVKAINNRLELLEKARKNLVKKSDYYRSVFQTTPNALSTVFNQMIAEEIQLTIERDAILELLKNEKNS